MARESSPHGAHTRLQLGAPGGHISVSEAERVGGAAGGGRRLQRPHKHEICRWRGSQSCVMLSAISQPAGRSLNRSADQPHQMSPSPRTWLNEQQPGRPYEGRIVGCCLEKLAHRVGPVGLHKRAAAQGVAGCASRGTRGAAAGGGRASSVARRRMHQVSRQAASGQRRAAACSTCAKGTRLRFGHLAAAGRRGTWE